MSTTPAQIFRVCTIRDFIENPGPGYYLLGSSFTFYRLIDVRQGADQQITAKIAMRIDADHEAEVPGAAVINADMLLIRMEEEPKPSTEEPVGAAYWVVRRTDRRGAYLQTAINTHMEKWTTDETQAVRYFRQEDAQRAALAEAGKDAVAERRICAKKQETK